MSQHQNGAERSKWRPLTAAPMTTGTSPDQKQEQEPTTMTPVRPEESESSDSEMEEGLIIDASDEEYFSPEEGEIKNDHEIAKDACSENFGPARKVERLIITIENPRIGTVEMEREATFVLLCNNCHEMTLHKIDVVSNLSNCQWCLNQYSSLNEVVCRNFLKDRKEHILETRHPIRKRRTNLETRSPAPPPPSSTPESHETWQAKQAITTPTNTN